MCKFSLNMELFVDCFLSIVLLLFLLSIRESSSEFVKGHITCSDNGHEVVPEQLISRFEIENEEIEVVLTRSEIYQHIPMYKISPNGSLLRKQHVDSKKSIIYESQTPTVFVKVKFQCQTSNDVLHRMTGFIVWNNKHYVINSDPDLQYLNTAMSAHLKSIVIPDNTAYVKAEKTRSTRFLGGSTLYNVKILIVVDYSLYAVFYNSSDDDLGEVQRSSKTEQDLEEYLGLVFHSVNVAYSSLRAYSLNIKIVPVAIVMSTDEHNSPWTLKHDDFSESIGSNGKHMVNGSEVLDHLAEFVAGLTTIAKPDHALLYSRYDLDFDSETLENNTETVGLATLRGICTKHSVSMVRDDMDFSVISVTSHEIGHSLGAEHDEDGNSCPKSVGNIMAPKEHRSEPNQWKFSNCSANYFKTNIKKLDRYNNNCLLTDNSHLLSSLVVSSKEWYGQIYNADQQCELSLGNGSYLDRGHYNGSSEYIEKLCLNMTCTDPTEEFDRTFEAGDGTVCARNQWCMGGFCVSASIPLNVSDDCPQGDLQHITVKNEMPCAELVTKRPQECYLEKVRKPCCDICKRLKPKNPVLSDLLNAPSANDQCIAAYGSDSKFCQGVEDYNVTFSSICSNMYCLTDPVNDTCTSIAAKDGTTCGHKQWCVKGEYVHNDQATDLPENCLYGDKASWCKTELDDSHKYYYCYNENNTKACCDSCEKLKNETDQDCLYGDRHHWCKEEIPDRSRMYKCLVRNYTYECCGTCSHFRNKGIPDYVHLQATPSVNRQCADEFGNESRFCQHVSDYSESYSSICSDLYCLRNKTSCRSITAADGTTCGYRKWCVRGSCVHSEHTKDIPRDCLYGDKESWCKTSIPDESKKMMCYYGSNADSCCETCRMFRNESAPECWYGDKTDWCKKNIPDESHRRSCYYGNNAKLCCKTCAKYRNTAAPVDCMYGDKSDSCVTDITEANKRYCYDANNIDLCCATCNTFRNDSSPGCEYGDHSSSCRRDRCHGYSDHTRTSVCCETCK